MNDPRLLLAIPVYNEERYVDKVLTEVRRYAEQTPFDVLVVDDGSTDGTPLRLARHPVEVIRHATNRGYGRSMQDMLRWADFDAYDWLVTMDCDEQHEPAALPSFVAAIRAAERGEHPADVVSGSRYLVARDGDDSPPQDRRSINATITAELNCRLGDLLMGPGVAMTDAFCGFKAYRVRACGRLRLDVDGYDFPMQFWVQAAAQRLAVREIPVRLIYNDPTRTFGGPLNDPQKRLAAYRRTLTRELRRCADRLPSSALHRLDSICHDGSATSIDPSVDASAHPSVRSASACGC
ncbi:MAG: glycosyltransferase family 2 protein [Phycisphaerales bacterium]